jgi:hypothetical protein
MTIKGIMDGVKEEENPDLQHRSAAGIAGLVAQLVATERNKVVEKVVGNLVKFCCMETGETPEFHPNADREAGILSLQKDEDIQDRPDAAKYEREVKRAKITRRGAKDALEQLCRIFGADLFNKVPKLRSVIEDPIRQCFSGELPADLLDPENEFGQAVVDASWQSCVTLQPNASHACAVSSPSKALRCWSTKSCRRSTMPTKLYTVKVRLSAFTTLFRSWATESCRMSSSSWCPSLDA